jgi:hypothetical protein
MSDLNDIINGTVEQGCPEDNPSCIIAWRNTVRPGSGRGTKLMTRTQAEILVRELNEQYPQITHWVEEL